MHLMYTRFFTKAMRECGIWDDTSKLRKPGQPPVDDEPMLALFNQGMILGEPRGGNIIVAKGTWEANRLNAATIEVIADSAAETHGFSEDAKTVIGEIVKRTETFLNVEKSDGQQVTVEVMPVTKITDPGGNEITLADLRYHLDAEKMSKSKGNVVAPDQVVARYGADTVRGYLMFAFRWELGGPWDSQGIQGVVRWLNDVWNLVTEPRPQVSGQATEADVRALRRKTHQTIQRVTEGLDTFGFNTAVAALMELKNALMAARKTPVVNDPAYDEAVATMLLMMAPFTPHIAEELWECIGRQYSIHQQPWPQFDAAIAKADEITLVVQVNGKVRDRITVPADISEEDAKAKALASEGAQKFINGNQPKKVFYVADRGMVNIVV
jgi:leucyl-tRNA synthetase